MPSSDDAIFKIHTIQLNIGRFMGEIAHMDGTEIGAYTCLVLAAFQSPDTLLPLSETRLCRMARVSPKVWGRIRETIIGAMQKEPTGFRITWVQEDAQKYRTKSANYRANALKKWEVHNAVAKLGQSNRNATQDPRRVEPPYPQFLAVFDVKKALTDYELREMLELGIGDRNVIIERYNRKVRNGEIQFPNNPASHFMAWIKNQPEGKRHKVGAQ